MHPDNKNKKVRGLTTESATRPDPRPSWPDLPRPSSARASPPPLGEPSTDRPTRPPPDGPAPLFDPDPARHAGAPLRSRRRLALSWFVALFWNIVAFPMASLALLRPISLWTCAISLLVVGLGLALLWEALHQTWLAWHYQGSRLQIRPARPRAGQPLSIDLHLPRRARETWPPGETPRWCLTQHRIDETTSGSPEREVECIECPARWQDLGAAGLHLSARLVVPADAPPDGSPRGRETVAWRLSLRTADGRILQDYGVPVAGGDPTHLSPAGAPASPTPPDRFAPTSGPAPAVDIPPMPPDARPPRLPPAVQWHETPAAGRLVFAQAGWRGVGGLALLCALAVALPSPGGRGGLSLLLLTASLALGMHGLTRRWTLWVHDEGLLLERRSWLWLTRVSLPASALQGLSRRETHQRRRSGRLQDFQALHTSAPLADGGTRLSPGLPGRESAEALAGFLRWAFAQRQGRFSPGARRDVRRTSVSQPGWGLALLVAVLVWLLQRH